MRIAINTLAMKRQLFGGGNYIKNLVTSLSKIDLENDYLIIASLENMIHLKHLGPRFHIELGPANRALRLPWEQTLLPFRLRQRQIDVYHGPAFVAPLLKTCGQVVSVHDMTFHLVPERHSLHKRIYFQAIIPAVIKNADHVIAVSESTRRDILDLIPVKEECISVTHLGVDNRFAAVLDKNKLSELRKRFNLSRDFILSVGVLEPRKNLSALVDAYQASSLPEQFDLAIVGSLGWGYSPLLRQIAHSPVREHIRMLGYVADEDLPALYTSAAVFAYPSLYEGFGLPPLEAMACGTPVITSAISSLPEIAGDAAILVDPNNVQELSFALRQVLQNQDLRKELSRRGIERARQFTWERMAEKTLEVYKHVARRHWARQNLAHAKISVPG
jgi:glycosyltransferase involved in cell wall biosynthesis